eukprot:TRINITY_DN16622_c0_g1_i1.p1 TRINITY_DN16622_c0_g1~~TRINITY_DN16622_c0_g1_i1.p1  ORF type:complete len:211 (+),score=50.24 TRINITY_DN16622_c0_g1_i1:564-1196(+)
MHILLTLGDYHWVLQLLHEIQMYDNAALFAEVCLESGHLSLSSPTNNANTTHLSHTNSLHNLSQNNPPSANVVSTSPPSPSASPLRNSTSPPPILDNNNISSTTTITNDNTHTNTASRSNSLSGSALLPPPPVLIPLDQLINTVYMDYGYYLHRLGNILGAEFYWRKAGKSANEISNMKNEESIRSTKSHRSSVSSNAPLTSTSTITSNV